MSKPEFFCYNAGVLAINPARPWQIITRTGAVVGKLPTEEAAQTAVEELEAARLAGTLPCNVSRWEKAHLLG